MGNLARALRMSSRVAIVALPVSLLLLTAAPAGAQVSRDNRAPPLLVPSRRGPIVATPASAAPPAAPARGAELPPVAAGAVPETFTPSEEFQQWITELAREHLPDKYEKTKNWGKTTKVWDGLKVSLEDGRLETKRRWKQANDGTWYKYRADLVEPEKHFDIRIHNIREIGGGKIAADVRASARLKCFGRMSQWEHGVQLISLSVDAETSTVLSAQIELGMQLDFGERPPAVKLVPEVRSARIDLYDFRLQRVSNAHGPLVKSLSSSVREMVEDRIEEQNRGKLAEKLNKQIARQQDKLRLKLPAVAKSPWAALLPRDAGALAP